MSQDKHFVLPNADIRESLTPEEQAVLQQIHSKVDAYRSRMGLPALHFAVIDVDDLFGRLAMEAYIDGACRHSSFHSNAALQSQVRAFQQVLREARFRSDGLVPI
jgi:hypothetical protein